MAIDPSIILGVRPIQAPQSDPMDRFAKILTLRNAQDQGALQGLQLRQAQTALDDEEAVRGAYRESGGDAARLRQILGERGQYKALQGLDKADLERASKQAAIDKDKAQSRKYGVDADIARFERGAALFGTARDQQSYDAALRLGVMTNVFTPQEVAQLPEQFNPQVVQTMAAAGMTRAQQLTDERDRERLGETRRSNLANEQTARGNLAVNQGNLQNARDRLAYERGKPIYDTERGVFIDPATRVATPAAMAGGSALPGKPLTESQGRGQMFGTRAAAADQILRNIEGDYSTLGLVTKQGAEGVPLVGGVLGVAGNALMSTNQQKADQAQRDFVNAVLRQESGAVISPQEFENARKQYFPQPGDTQAVIDQKLANRKTAIDGFKGMAGSAANRITEAEGDRTPKPKIPTRAARGGLRGVLTQNPDGSFNYGAAE